MMSMNDGDGTFQNEFPGEDWCPFCQRWDETEEIGDDDVNAEEDGIFWVDRRCMECDAKWRDYYDPEGAWADTCVYCGSEDIEVEMYSGSIDKGTGNSETVCNDCGGCSLNSYTYSFSSL